MSASTKRSTRPATRAIAILAATVPVIAAAAAILVMRGHDSAPANPAPATSTQSVRAQMARTEAQWQQSRKLRPLGPSQKPVATAPVSVVL